MSETPQYAEVVLPLAVPKLYTYLLPLELAAHAAPGIRAVVQFGARRFYTAIIWRIHSQEPETYRPKIIEALLDEHPIIDENQMKLWEWIAGYYLCTLGDVMNAALPAGMKLESETIVMLHPHFNHSYENLDDDGYLVAEALTVQHQLKVKEVQDLLGKKTVYPLLRQLIDLKVVVLEESIREGYKPKTEQVVKLSEDYNGQSARHALFEELNRAPKQLDILMNYFHMASLGKRLTKAELLEATGRNYTAFSRMVERGIFVLEEETVSRIQTAEESGSGMPELSAVQQEAMDSIRQQWEQKDVVLLHGVTSSGKTEIYIRLMQEALDAGKQVLYLLPEIALTAQMVQRLQRVFGKETGIYHSRFSAMERVEIWQHVQAGRFRVLIGARSALFLPFRNLGLVIVDEEHDRSYKQFDPAPRYNARDSAILMASIYGAKVLMGSATPSIESYYNARKGKYGMVELMQRYGGVQMPELRLVDVAKSARVADSATHLSETLVGAIKDALDQREQVILFRNRRGYASMLVCGTCGHTPECKNCDISLTYHRYVNQLRCHYCGYHIPTVVECPACGAHNMRVMGFGTEKIEDELKLLFEHAKVGRLDLDAAKGKHGHAQIISDFEQGRLDILVGTQMVTKGLDFERVGLVGILSADQLMHFPEFRAHERAFQLMVQVSGRSGRKHKQGKVLIQARNLTHPILHMVLQNDYVRFYEEEIAQRRKFSYPPIVRLVQLHLRHKDSDRVLQAARQVHELLQRHLGKRVYDPVVPSPARLRGLFLADILIKLERKGTTLHLVRDLIRQAETLLAQDSKLKSVQIFADADPY